MTRMLSRGLVSVIAVALLATAFVGAQAGASSSAPYIVQLSDPPLASYRGGISGLEATNPAARGEVKLDPPSAASRAYLDYLRGRQSSFLTNAQLALGRTLEPQFRYRYAFNGLAVTLTATEAARVADMPGVKDVQREQTYDLLTDVGPAWIGAPALWNGTGTGGSASTKGEGVIVGVIDTGVNHDHPSFADVGGDGYNHTNPRGTFYGVCDPVTGRPFCNDKLIGAWDFTGTSPEDDNAHGSHTASTAAGNVLSAKIQAPTLTLTRNISGVAPHANLITYKACDNASGGCRGISLAAAIDQATADAVDVINFSIGGGSRNPWTDSNALGFLGARDAGIFVSASAGNSGPKPETIGSPSNAPWLMSVGASTHNRKFANAVVNMSGGATTPPADIEGKSFTAGYGPATIVHAADFGDRQCLSPFAPGTFSGEIVICERGVNPRVEKGRNVELGGAGGMVLANSAAEGESIIADPHELPAVHIGYNAGQRLEAWVRDGGSGHTATIAGTTPDEAASNGDIMAGFTSRGPDKTVPGVLKPDVTAPGVDVLAAINTVGNTTSPAGSPEFGVLSGTSMSAPHSAGAAALVRDVRPGWTPAEVQSALMTTSLTTGIRKEDGVKAATPFDRGAGRIDLTQAARAGLVLNETVPNYEAADPAAGGNPTTLNTASLANADCRGTCTWTRVVETTLGSSTTWTAKTSAPRGVRLTVQPSRFTIAPGGSQTITVTADVVDAPVGQWSFAELTLSSKAAPAAHLPIALYPGGTPQAVGIAAAATSGSHTVTATSEIAIERFSSVVSGLAEGKIVNERLEQDPTSGYPIGVGASPYSAAAGTFHTTLDVPAGARFLTAEITKSTAPDIDLFVGLDSDGDRRPDSAEEVCRSASEIWEESCTLKAPAAGTWWVLVQNWQSGLTGVDDVQLTASVIPSTDNGNLTVTGPSGSIPAGQPFDITLSWNEPQLEPGDAWFALVEYGTDRRHPNNAGSLLVAITRSG
jgi:subtilisin family serine protease